MFKWERRLAERIDRYLPELIFVLITLIAAFMRFREGIWHVSFDYQNQFYPELQTYTHTPFYTFFMRMICYVPMTPIRTMKYIICLFDFAVALEGTVLLNRLRGQRREKMVTLACYGLLLISPLSIANGLVWIHIDSICLCAVLGAYLLAERKKYSAAGLLLGLAMALQMQYSVFWLVAVIWSAGKQKKALPWLGVGAVLAAVLTVMGMAAEGMSAREGLLALVSWLVVSQETGEVFAGVLPWIAQILGQFCYLIGTAALLYAFYRPRRSLAAAVVYICVTVYLGYILQYGWAV